MENHLCFVGWFFFFFFLLVILIMFVLKEIEVMMVLLGRGQFLCFYWRSLRIETVTWALPSSPPMVDGSVTRNGYIS